MGVENVSYTNFNKSDWFYAITAYSFILLFLVRCGLMEERKIFITHFYASVCFRIFYSAHTQLQIMLRKRFGDLCKRAQEKEEASAVASKKEAKISPYPRIFFLRSYFSSKVKRRKTTEEKRIAKF